VVSRKDKLPSFRNSEKSGYFGINLVNFTKEKDGKLNMDYYIGVFSISDCVYTINVIVERNESKDVPEIERAVRLWNGVP